MTNSIDRRQFMQNTATTGAVATTALSAAQAFSQESAANKLVVGVMGLSRGRSLAVGFAQMADVEVKYVCDVDRDRAGSGADLVVGANAPKPMVITDFRRILEDKDVDILVCAAPNHWHAPATIMGCNAGKHVYVEKPCSHNPFEGELMVAAARKNNRAVQMGTQRRSAPETILAIDALRGGAIGRVYHSRAFYASARPPIHPGTAPANVDFDLWQGPAPRLDEVRGYVHYNWHWRWHWGNGELGNNGVHTLDLCRWGMGVDYPLRVSSSGGRYHHVADSQETPDTQTVSFEFAGNRQITWTGLSCNRHRTDFVIFYGTGGTLELDSSGSYRIYDTKDALVKEVHGAALGDAQHKENFVTAIRMERPLSLNSEILEGHKSTLLCHLGNIAQRTGRLLNCDPTDGRILEDPEAMSLWARDYEPGWEPVV